MNLSIYLPQPMLSQVKQAAKKDNRSVSQFIRMVLVKNLREKKSEQ